jgi:hypothetical protein
MDRRFLLRYSRNPRAVFIRMYGTCECEAPARQGKPKRIPYIRLGTALVVCRRLRAAVDVAKDFTAEVPGLKGQTKILERSEGATIICRRPDAVATAAPPLNGVRELAAHIERGDTRR